MATHQIILLYPFLPCIAEEPPKRKEMVNVKPKVLGIGTHKESEEQIQAGPKESRDTVRDTVVGVPYREGKLVV